jgi:hypothetical protein
MKDIGAEKEDPGEDKSNSIDKKIDEKEED